MILVVLTMLVMLRSSGARGDAMVGGRGRTVPGQQSRIAEAQPPSTPTLHHLLTPTGVVMARRPHCLGMNRL